MYVCRPFTSSYAAPLCVFNYVDPLPLYFVPPFTYVFNSVGPLPLHMVPPFPLHDGPYPIPMPPPPHFPPSFVVGLNDYIIITSY